MSNAEFTTPPNKSTKTTTNHAEITKNEKIILVVLSFIMSIFLVAIGQKILQTRFPVGHNSIMVGSDRYRGILGNDSMQYIFNLAQFKKTNIELFSDLPQSAELSPDGQWIVFGRRESTSDGFSAYRIYIMRVDGTQQTLVPVHYGEEPTWSPDGKQIAFHGSISKSAGIYIVNIDCLLRGEPCTPAPRLLVEQPAGYPIISPDWSPDGTKIAYTTLGQSQISVIDVSGDFSRIQLPRNISGTFSDPQWSPDGTKIVGICRGSISGVCVMNNDGSNLVLLKEDTKKEYAEQPSWSPDGQMIAFISTALNHQIPQSCWPDGCSSILRPSSVVIMTADGKAVTELPFDDRVITRWFFWHS